MLSTINNWSGKVTINGVDYDTMTEAILNAKLNASDEISITLHAKRNDAQKRSESSHISVSDDAQQYVVTVRQYMTKPASAGFDFMKKWNNNRPMPFRTMIGTVEKETRGMIYMKLHADIFARTLTTCMCCGRTLTNPVSQYFGVGPECGGHNYVHPFNSDEELRAAVDSYRSQLQKITWEGWIIKSAITSKEEYDAG